MSLSLALLWVSRRAPAEIEGAAGDYVARVRRFATFDELRLRPVAGRDDVRRVLAAEASDIRARLRPGDVVVALDERGSERTTEELAAWVQRTATRGRLVFLIGSDLGLDPEIKREAAERLALSRLTLPHHLARLVLLEQLYRCLDLLSGGSYHRP